MSDPLIPQWEMCKVCGGDHWTKDHPKPLTVEEIEVIRAWLDDHAETLKGDRPTEYARRLLATLDARPALDERAAKIEKYARALVEWLDGGGKVEPWPNASRLNDLRAVLGDTGKKKKARRIDWSNVVVDEGDEAP